MGAKVSDPLLVATGISKRFGRKTVLSEAMLKVHRGEAVGLVGENGAGKTTLLRICAGFLTPDSGQVKVGGAIGYCPQEPGVLDLLTAEEHLVYFGAGMGLSRAQSLTDGRRLLSELGFQLQDRSVAVELSGGNRQKLNLALALIGDPQVLLLDEPYQGFDYGTYVDFWEHVGVWRLQGKAIVIVTHMLAELDRVDTVIELKVTMNPSAEEEDD